MKQLLITGGSGLIGCALIAQLKRQYRITVLTRDVQRCQRLWGNDFNYIASLTPIDDIGQFRAVINLAGEPIANKRWRPAQKKQICESRWTLTRALVAKIMESTAAPEVFISGSAIGFYGRQPDDVIIDEEFTAIHDEFTHHVCATWERIAREASSVCRVVLLRTGVVLAQNKGALKKMALPFKLGLGGVLGSGRQMLSWIHLDDVVAAILFLLNNHACQGPFNLTAPHPVSNKVFTKILAAQFKRPAWLTVPVHVQRLLFGEMADLLIYGQNVVPKKLLEAGFDFRYPSLKPALEAIYSP